MAAWDAEAIEYAFRPLEVDAYVSGVAIGLDPASFGQDAWGIACGAWGMRKVDPDEGYEREPVLRSDGTPSGAYIVHRDRPRARLERPKPILHLWNFATIAAAFRHAMEIDQIADEIAGTRATSAREGRKPKADPMAKRTPGIPGPSACHEPFGS